MSLIAGMLPPMLACQQCEVEWHLSAGRRCFNEPSHDGRPILEFAVGNARRNRNR